MNNAYDATPAQPSRGASPKPAMQHDMTEAMRAGVAASGACREQCLVTFAHAAESGGELAAAPHLQLLLDCAALCAVTTDLLARGSVRHRELSRLCAEVCRACEASCRSMPQGSTVQRCAEQCHACAEACEKVVRAV